MEELIVTTETKATGIIRVNKNSVLNMLGKPTEISIGSYHGWTVAATCIPLIDGINGMWRGAMIRMIEDEQIGFRITAEMHPLMGERSPYPTFAFVQDESMLSIGDVPTENSRNLTLRTVENKVDGDPKWLPVLAAAARMADTAKLFQNLREQVVEDQELESWSKFSRVPGPEGDRWSIQHTDILCDGMYNSHVCTGDKDVDEVRHTIQHMMLSVAIP
jgi:hypothetical protein